MNRLFIQGVFIDWEKISPDSYLWDIPALSGLKELEFEKNVTFLVGENGSGKSTFLEGLAVAYGFHAEGGNKNYYFSTYDSHSELHEAMRLIRGFRRPKGNYFLRAESFYNVASQSEEYRGGDLKEEYYYQGKSFHEQSHGESFFSLVQGYFKPDGIYLLDEPEAALSPQRQLSLLLELHRLSKNGAQFILASHSPILLALPGADIFSFDKGEVHRCAYEETESYQITEMFINNRDYFLKKLLTP